MFFFLKNDFPTPNVVGPKFELEFTAAFSEQDLFLVNKIREMLQDLISEKIFQRESLREASLQMKRNILELVTKLRKPITISTNTFREKWKQAVWGEEEWETTAAEADPWSEEVTAAASAAATSNDTHTRVEGRGDIEGKKLFPAVAAKQLVKAEGGDDGLFVCLFFFSSGDCLADRRSCWLL